MGSEMCIRDRIKAGTKIGKAKAKCTVGKQIVSEAEITFALVDQN